LSLGKYLVNCDALWKELRDHLNDDDIDALDAEIAAIGESGWKKWKEDNSKPIDNFIVSTPKQRQKIKDSYLFRKLVFACLQRCTGGVYLLLAMKKRGIEEPFFMSYRDMLDRASNAYEDMVSKPFPWVPSDLHYWESSSPFESAELEFFRAAKKRKNGN
jgi:hypothetical protein